MNSEHIFLSYARRDGSQYVERLEHDLTSAGYETWRDKRTLNEYNDFSAEIEIGIRSASYVVVCVTPSVEQNPSSFVRREIIYAQTKQKPIIPLVFPKANVPILINHLTWIPFFDGDDLRYEAGFDELLKRLRLAPSRIAVRQNADDPFRDYLDQLYEWIVSYLEKSTFSLITLSSLTVPEAVVQPETDNPILPNVFLNTFALSAGIEIAPRSQPAADSYRSFPEAFEAYHGRVLLLGDPGSGKTTTLMAFARDAIVSRLENPKAPLPLLAPVSTWNPYDQPQFAEWLSNSVPSLKDAIYEIVQAGHALLILDGLDELGSERLADPEHPDRETFDPRQRFILRIPTQNQILLTCRLQDYQAIGKKVSLQGAVYLQPLSDGQIADYLSHQPDLQAILQRDRQLKELVRTPLLLSLVTFGFADAVTELSSLEGLGKGDVSDRIFEAYLQRRFEHEQRKSFAHLPYSYEKMVRSLRCVARTDAMGESQNTIHHLYINQCLGYEPEEFIEQTVRLHILLPTIDPKIFQFTHLLLRNYFAYPDLIRSLTHKDQWRRLKATRALGELGDNRAVEALCKLFSQESDENVRSMAAVALGKIGSSEGVPCLVEALQDNRARVRGAAAQALADVGDGSAVKGLVILAQDGDKMIRLLALEAIANNHDPQAIPVLVEALNNANSAVSQAASTALRRIGSNAVPALLEGLQSNDVNKKRWAALTLGKMHALEAVPLLIALLGDSTPSSFMERVGDIAAEALLLIATPEAVAAVESWKRQ